MSEVFERYFTETEERQLFRCVGQYQDILARRDLQWMIVLRQTGIRIGAFARLTVYDAQQVMRTGYLQLSADIQKRKKPQTVYVTKKAKAAFKALLAIRREQGYAEIPDEPLVMSRKRQALSVRSYQARMRHWCHAADLDLQASPHWFRHTSAKRLLARSTANDPIGIVQSALNHSSRNTTAIYTRPDRETVREAMEAAS